MDPRGAATRATPAPPEPATAVSAGDPDALEFIRFCYRRKRVGWPELYDEMCAVASRGLYRGWCPEDLAGVGIGFSLFEMPALAILVHQVVSEDQESRRRTAAALRATLPEAAAPVVSHEVEPEPETAVDHPPVRIAVAVGA